MSDRPLSPTMLEALGRIAAGVPLFEGCVSRNSYGGRAGTLWGLKRRGLIVLSHTPSYSATLTDAGRAELDGNKAS